MTYSIIDEIMNKDYIYGLLLSDGTLALYGRNRGRVSIEVSLKDIDIIEKISVQIPNGSIHYRTRKTNFSKEYRSVAYYNHHREFREELMKRGFPAGNKCEIVQPPIDDYLEEEFWRGYIDGDGSIGFTKEGLPYISIVTKSDAICSSFLNFLERRLGIIKILSRNKRDNCYNIVIKNEDAVELSRILYADADIYLNRKYQKYLEIQKWKRTKKKIHSQSWSKEEDNFILSHRIEESISELKRTKSSIKMRLYRLKIDN